MNRSETQPRLLYLGFAFPPGWQERFPDVNPAGHAFETQMIGELRRHFEIKSAGTLPLAIDAADKTPNPSAGVNHDLLLVEKPPELLHRWRSLARLRRWYQSKSAVGWVPDAVLVYNLSPIYNQFIRWLRRQPNRPRLVLLFADSATLGRSLSCGKKFRQRFKPMLMPDAESITLFDACIALSRDTEPFFAAKKIPWLWMSGGCVPEQAPSATSASGDGPITFGYFGSLAAHAGVSALIENFLTTSLSNTLHICGYGKQSEAIASLARQNPRLRFHGLLPTPADCLTWAQSIDVLVNPRAAGRGNENNFPSKLFQYALSGRAILSTRLSGIDAVLGEEAFYFDAEDFDRTLRQQLEQLATVPRAELRRRGEEIRQRVAKDYSWERQAERAARFIQELLARSR